MIKKYIKRIALMLVIAIMILSFSNNTYARPESAQTQLTEGEGAGGSGGSGGSGGTAKMSELITTLDAGAEGDATAGKVKDVVTTVITIARVIGVAVAIVMLLVVAMKYMAAAPGEKADIKKSAVVYVVGAIILFAVTGILGIINTFSSNITLN